MSRRILVADDSSTIQKVIKIALSRHAIEIVEAGSYLEALTASQRTQPSMLILDASLPGARGPADFLKLAQEAQGAPILLLVGTYDSVDESAFRQAGFAHFLKKPFESGDIVSQVDALLGDGEGTSSSRGGAYATQSGERGDRAQHNTVIHEGGYQTLSGFDPTRPPPAPAMSAEASLDLGRDDEQPRGFVPPPPPVIEQGRKGRRAFEGEVTDSGRAPGGMANVPPPPLSLGGLPEDDQTVTRRPPPERQPSPLPPIPPGTGLGASLGISLSLEDEEGFKPQKTQPPSSPDALAKELPAWVRQAVEDYCERHFKSLARDIIATELRRLADEKARHLVDQ